jgi:hypothetical protein
MVDFKTFCKIRYPNWLESSPVFIPSRPNIEELFSKTSESETLELLVFLNKAEKLKAYILSR